MEWIVIGLIVWWWCASRTRAQKRNAECSGDSALGPHLTAMGDSGPLVTEGILMAVTDDYAYWRLGGELMRAPYVNGQADVQLIEPADPLTSDDLPPALVVEVLDALDAAEANMRRARDHR